MGNNKTVVVVVDVGFGEEKPNFRMLRFVFYRSFSIGEFSNQVQISSRSENLFRHRRRRRRRRRRRCERKRAKAGRLKRSKYFVRNDLKVVLKYRKIQHTRQSCVQALLLYLKSKPRTWAFAFPKKKSEALSEKDVFSLF